MSQSPSLEQILETHLQTLALTLRPSTVSYYRYLAHGFLRYLHAHFPQLRRLSQLRRDPHLLGWFRWLCALQPPLCNQTRTDYLARLRRLLDDLAAKPAHAAEVQRLMRLLRDWQQKLDDTQPLTSANPQPADFDFSKVKAEK